MLVDPDFSELISRFETGSCLYVHQLNEDDSGLRCVIRLMDQLVLLHYYLMRISVCGDIGNDVILDLINMIWNNFWDEIHKGFYSEIDEYNHRYGKKKACCCTYFLYLVALFSESYSSRWIQEVESEVVSYVRSKLMDSRYDGIYLHIDPRLDTMDTIKDPLAYGFWLLYLIQKGFMKSNDQEILLRAVGLIRRYLCFNDLGVKKMKRKFDAVANPINVPEDLAVNILAIVEYYRLTGDPQFNDLALMLASSLRKLRHRDGLIYAMGADYLTPVYPTHLFQQFWSSYAWIELGEVFDMDNWVVQGITQLRNGRTAFRNGGRVVWSISADGITEGNEGIRSYLMYEMCGILLSKLFMADPSLSEMYELIGRDDKVPVESTEFGRYCLTEKYERSIKLIDIYILSYLNKTSVLNHDLQNIMGLGEVFSAIPRSTIYSRINFLTDIGLIDIAVDLGRDARNKVIVVSLEGMKLLSKLSILF